MRALVHLHPGQSAQSPRGRCVRRRERESFVSECTELGAGPGLVCTQARPPPRTEHVSSGPVFRSSQGRGAVGGVWAHSRGSTRVPSSRVAPHLSCPRSAE